MPYICRLKKNLEVNKTVLTVIFFGVIQLAATAGVMFYFLISGFRGNSRENPASLVLLLCLVTFVVLIDSAIVIRSRRDLSRSGQRQKMLYESIKQIEDLNRTLRSQRHDFLNHLQVVYSLMELEEFREASDYIERVYGDIQKVSRFLKTSIPAVNALLQAKVISCENKGIRARLEVSSQLKDFPIPSWEFCRVLGNLIDNAAYELEKLDKERQLSVRLTEDLKSFIVEIGDNGPGIASKDLDRIFKAGFSTKGEKGEGMGLFISKEIIEAFNGNIIVASSPEETIFKCVIPRTAVTTVS